MAPLPPPCPCSRKWGSCPLQPPPTLTSSASGTVRGRASPPSPNPPFQTRPSTSQHLSGWPVRHPSQTKPSHRTTTDASIEQAQLNSRVLERPPRRFSDRDLWLRPWGPRRDRLTPEGEDPPQDIPPDLAQAIPPVLLASPPMPPTPLGPISATLGLLQGQEPVQLQVGYPKDDHTPRSS